MLLLLRITMTEKLQATYLLNKILIVTLKSYSYSISVLEKCHSYLVEIREMQHKKIERDEYENVCF